MIATIAMITVIAEKKKVQWSQPSYGNHFPEFAATMIAEIEKILSQRSITTIAGKWFPYDHYDLYHAITVLFFLSDHSDRSDHMETRLKLRIFTTQNTFQ